ncbi:MAG: hypothetical protein LRY73_15720 [Bacillus sp. (in: Bacteria)]|nr:hypothetical protein [Bacillus sp. (in: firmicutes)]
MIQRLKKKYNYAIVGPNTKLSPTYQLKIADEAGEVIVFDTRKLSQDEKELLEIIFPQEENNVLLPQTASEELLIQWLIKKR